MKVDGDTAAARSAEAAWGRGAPGGGPGLSGIARAGGRGAWGEGLRARPDSVEAAEAAPETRFRYFGLHSI